MLLYFNNSLNCEENDESEGTLKHNVFYNNGYNLY